MSTGLSSYMFFLVIYPCFLPSQLTEAAETGIGSKETEAANKVTGIGSKETEAANKEAGNGSKETEVANKEAGIGSK